MTCEDEIKEIANKLTIPEEVAKEAYKSFWKYVRSTIIELPLKNNLTEEEFNSLKTNFNIPSLGKLNVTYDRLVGVKKRFKYLKRINNGRLED